MKVTFKSIKYNKLIYIPSNIYKNITLEYVLE
jgi:hypothetical protein